MTERKRLPDARQIARPHHFDSAYEVRVARAVGKPQHWDIVLIRKTAPGVGFKSGVKVIRAWRGRFGDGKPGTPQDLALKEAHDLRYALDVRISREKR